MLSGVPEAFQGGGLPGRQGQSCQSGILPCSFITFFVDISTIKTLKFWSTLAPLRQRAAGNHISNIFQINHEIYSHQTRSFNNFRKPLFRFVNLPRSFMYTGVTTAGVTK